MAVSIQPSSELVELFTTYTGSPTAIGARYAQAAAFETNGDPLIVATSADLVLFPGAGAPPEIEGFRLSTRGFKEMAAVSHLGPAVATLARMRALGADWRPGAGGVAGGDARGAGGQRRGAVARADRRRGVRGPRGGDRGHGRLRVRRHRARARARIGRARTT